MTKVKTEPAQLTDEQIEAKAVQLSEKHGVKVFPIVFVDEEEQVIGFLKEPDRETKFRVLDASEYQRWSVGRMLVASFMLKEESDARFFSEAPAHDAIVIGAAKEATNTILLKFQQYKKK